MPNSLKIFWAGAAVLVVLCVVLVIGIFFKPGVPLPDPVQTTIQPPPLPPAPEGPQIRILEGLPIAQPSQPKLDLLQDPSELCRSKPSLFMPTKNGPAFYADCDKDGYVDLASVPQGVGVMTLVIVPSQDDARLLNYQWLEIARKKLGAITCPDGKTDYGEVKADDNGEPRLWFCSQAEALENPYVSRDSEPGRAAQIQFDLATARALQAK